MAETSLMYCQKIYIIFLIDSPCCFFKKSLTFSLHNCAITFNELAAQAQFPSYV